MGKKKKESIVFLFSEEIRITSFFYSILPTTDLQQTKKKKWLDNQICTNCSGNGEDLTRIKKKYGGCYSHTCTEIHLKVLRIQHSQYLSSDSSLLKSWTLQESHMI
jgi:hypothetical protein